MIVFMNKPKYISNLALLVLLPIIGATVMYALIFAFNKAPDSTLAAGVYSVIIIFLGLAVPYWMLKAFSVAAHEWNPREKELHLVDLPKDKEQMDRKTNAS